MATFLIAFFLLASSAKLTLEQIVPASGTNGNPNLCQTPSATIGEQYFSFRSSLFQVFTNFKVGCSGYVTRWAMLSRTQGGMGLHLSVWRQVTTAQNAQSNVWRLIGTTDIPPYSVTPGTWFEYQVRQPFAVQANDVVGMYYGDWEQPWSHNGFVPVTNSTQRLPRQVANFAGKTLVMQKDSDAIQQEVEASGGVVDLSNAATVLTRLPALMVFVDRDYVPGETLPPIIRTTTQNTQPRMATSPFKQIDDTTARTGCRLCGLSTPFYPPTQPPRREQLPTAPPQVFGNGGHSAQCFAPMRSAGNCNFTVNKFSTKYFFNVPLRECDLFWFFEDCVRTANLFETKEACEAKCQDFINRDIMP